MTKCMNQRNCEVIEIFYLDKSNIVTMGIEKKRDQRKNKQIKNLWV